MSTKLNAKEWYYKDQYIGPIHPEQVGDGSKQLIAMLERFAQPIADERDELRDVLGIAMKSLATYGQHPIIEGMASKLFAKYPKP